LVLEKENCVPKNKSYEAIGGQEASGTQWRWGIWGCDDENG
jgi:hypothetical protein